MKARSIFKYALLGLVAVLIQRIWVMDLVPDRYLPCSRHSPVSTQIDQWSRFARTRRCLYALGKHCYWVDLLPGRLGGT